MEYQIARQRIKMVGLHYTPLAEPIGAGRARMRKSGKKFGENRSKCESWARCQRRFSFDQLTNYVNSSHIPKRTVRDNRVAAKSFVHALVFY
ncbi:MAG TPA: hypothetical protein VFE47_17655 [Tepidisphaeraceae bacterium]|jgi:hypothetical protein|nr:hypothetical protein [Tepidisphaeraceae bacterium]